MFSQCITRIFHFMYMLVTFCMHHYLMVRHLWNILYILSNLLPHLIYRNVRFSWGFIAAIEITEDTPLRVPEVVPSKKAQASTKADGAPTVTKKAALHKHTFLLPVIPPLRGIKQQAPPLICYLLIWGL